MVRRYLSIVMIVLLVVCWSVPSFAYEATPSNSEELSMEDYLKNYKKIPLPLDNPGLGVVPDAPVHTSSDAEIWMGDDGLPVDDSLTLFSAGDINTNIGGTSVDITKCYVKLMYRTTNNQIISHVDFCDSKGRVSIPADLVNFSKALNIAFIIPKENIPSSGRYNLNASFGSDTGGFTYTKAQLFSVKRKPNVKDEVDTYEIPVFDQFSGDWKLLVSVEIGTPDRMEIQLIPDADFKPPYSGYFQLNFSYLGPTEPVDTSTAGGGSTSEDVQQNISSTNNQIAQNTASMNDTLKEIVQTISKQLEALWNQQYNYIHLEDMANADKNADKIVNSISDNISDQMINDDVNTDTIVNGFDNSAMDSTNNQLSSKLDEQAAQEQQILNQISAPLSSFEFFNPVTEYLSTFMLFGDFLQSLFVNSGGFKNVINLSFIMGIALMVAGLYRFKGGN